MPHILEVLIAHHGGEECIACETSLQPGARMSESTPKKHHFLSRLQGAFELEVVQKKHHFQ